MLQTLRPYNPTNAKTAQIMARYKPIAPRPEVPQENPGLTRVLPHLQARPSRTRKRGRTSVGPPFSAKRLRSDNNYFQGLYQFPPPPPSPRPPLYLPPVTSLGGFSNPVTTPATIVTVPLLHPRSVSPESDVSQKEVIDLNKPADVLEERDFLRQLQSPTTITAPQPLRLVGSTVTVWSITDDHKPGPLSPVRGNNVEDEVEFEAEPMVVTDSNNRVRAVSSAYKELVGQPECLWLEVLNRGIACKRICGEVVIRVINSDLSLPILSNGFSGRARIEWERSGKKRYVDMFFDATKLACESKNYQFAWRFYNLEASKSDYKV